MILPILLATCLHLQNAGETPATLVRGAFPDRPAGPATLVFFATWCPACRDSLAAGRTDDVILVGTLDERDRLERAYAQLGIGRGCLLDEDGRLLRLLGGKDVPYTATVTLSP